MVDSYREPSWVIIIPKSAPSQVIVHRIELQSTERGYLEQYVVANTIRNVVIPSAVVAGVGSAAYLGYKGLKAFFEWGTDVPEELWNDLKERVKEQKDSEFTEHKNIFGLPGWGIIPGIL